MRKGFALPFILLIVAVSIIAGGVVYWQFKSKPVPQPQPITTTQSTSTSTSTLTPDETADWKTYENTNGEYSFKYPPYISVKESVDEINRTRGVSPPVTSFITLEIRPYNTIQIVSAKKPQNLQIENALGDGPHLNYSKDILTGVDIKRIKIDGHDAFMVESVPVGVADGLVSDIVVVKGNTIYEIDLFHYDPENFKLLENILSTFKFTN